MRQGSRALACVVTPDFRADVGCLEVFVGNRVTVARFIRQRDRRGAEDVRGECDLIAVAHEDALHEVFVAADCANLAVVDFKRLAETRQRGDWGRRIFFDVGGRGTLRVERVARRRAEVKRGSRAFDRPNSRVLRKGLRSKRVVERERVTRAFDGDFRRGEQVFVRQGDNIVFVNPQARRRSLCLSRCSGDGVIFVQTAERRENAVFLFRRIGYASGVFLVERVTFRYGGDVGCGAL